MAALKTIEFDHMLPELEASLQNYRKIMKHKKDRKSLAGNAEKSNEGGADGDMEVDADDDVEVIDDWNYYQIFD